MSSEKEQSQQAKSFQVVDKRRFDSAGHERSAETSEPAKTDSLDNAPGTPESASAQGATGPHAQNIGAREPQFTMSSSPAEEEAEPVAFTSFIMSLATQVLVQLGEMEPPNGMTIPIDLDSARQTIDIMTMLQRRTRGNLSGDEARFMEEVLHSLRVSFINAKKKHR
jgi:hypothetical protein